MFVYIDVCEWECVCVCVSERQWVSKREALRGKVDEKNESEFTECKLKT